MLTLFFSGLLGYLLGSVPTAFLLVRWKLKRDIRSLGSGNVGTLNSFEVTGSKLVGVLVLVIDLLKGAVPVALAGLLWEGSFPHEAFAAVGALLGHNFPIWLKFRGGRGLATGAGTIFMLCWPLVVAWGTIWTLAFLLIRRVNPANAAASLLLLLLVELVPQGMLSALLSANIGVSEFRLFIAVALLIILVKHLEPVGAYIREMSNARGEEKQKT
ncbi:MAG TPA: glycerol-3-phosphate acyltransferase [Bacteroidota bacterium]|nr:glycerol-3-phosphate acyltransferase [Bacteroidota bacterium]